MHLLSVAGRIFAFGDTAYDGSMGGRPLNSPVVGMAADPATGGYWKVGADGGIFSFGTPFFNSAGDLQLKRAHRRHAGGRGRLGQSVRGERRGIFSDNGPFFGSMGGRPLNKPVVAMAGS